jgi:hypothetical protein
MFRVSTLTISLLLPLAGSGCATVEVGMRNPVVGLETVAIAPFFNLSQERTVDGREFALAYYAELQKVPGFEVLPVGVTERAMQENGISLSGPDDAVRLAKILDVAAVVIGAVTDYDPYNPRIGLKVAWYSPRQWLFLPNEDPKIPLFNRLADAPVKQPGRPKYGTPRAQSPDEAENWRSAETPRETNVEEGDWKTVGGPTSDPLFSPDMLLSDAGLVSTDAGFTTEHPVLPEGTSLLVPVDVVNFPTLPVPEEWPREAITISYQEIAPELPLPAGSLVPAPPADNADDIVPVQGGNAAPPVELNPSPTAQPIVPPTPLQGLLLPDSPALPEPPSLPVSPAKPNGNSTGSTPVAEPLTQPGSRRPSQQPVQPPIAAGPANDNPFNRHVPGSAGDAAPRGRWNQSSPEFNDGRRDQIPSRLVASEPEFPGTSDSAPATTTPGPQTPEPAWGTMVPVMKTPLFPMQRSEMNPAPMAMPRSTVPALVYDDQVLVAPTEFDSAKPLMAYVRLFDATDRRLIARLSDYLELTGQLRSGDLEAYMKRSEFFRKFTAHVMISEMLALHGGEARRQLILKPRKYC